MKDKINIPNSFADMQDTSNRKRFLPIDREFENEWIYYHYKNARLRMLCQRCNLTRTKTKNKFNMLKSSSKPESQKSLSI